MVCHGSPVLQEECQLITLDVVVIVGVVVHLGFQGLQSITKIRDWRIHTSSHRQTTFHNTTINNSTANMKLLLHPSYFVLLAFLVVTDGFTKE